MVFNELASLASELPPSRDYITTGGAVLMTMMTVLGTVLIALIQSNRKLTRRGVDAAETAAERSEPTGNGFAADVKRALARVESAQARMERDIGGIREEQRTERTERIALAAALSGHIERNDAT